MQKKQIIQLQTHIGLKLIQVQVYQSMLTYILVVDTLLTMEQ